MFVDLKAAYETVWHHGLTCKLLRLGRQAHGLNGNGTCLEQKLHCDHG